MKQVPSAGKYPQASNWLRYVLIGFVENVTRVTKRCIAKWEHSRIFFSIQIKITLSCLDVTVIIFLRHKSLHSNHMVPLNRTHCTSFWTSQLANFDETDSVSCLLLSVVGPFSPSQMASHLTRKDIERLAFTAGHFKRGEGCVRLVRDVSTSVQQDGVLFTAKCE